MATSRARVVRMPSHYVFARTGVAQRAAAGVMNEAHTALGRLLVLVRNFGAHDVLYAVLKLGENICGLAAGLGRISTRQLRPSMRQWERRGEGVMRHYLLREQARALATQEAPSCISRFPGSSCGSTGGRWTLRQLGWTGTPSRCPVAPTRSTSARS